MKQRRQLLTFPLWWFRTLGSVSTVLAFRGSFLCRTKHSYGRLRWLPSLLVLPSTHDEEIVNGEDHVTPLPKSISFIPVSAPQQVQPAIPLPLSPPSFSSVVNSATTLNGPASSNWCYWSTAYELTQAGMVGTLTGFSVAVFKLSIEAVRKFCYEQELLAGDLLLIALVPALGGIGVGLLYLLGGGNPFPPGLRGTVQQVDERFKRDTTRADDNTGEDYLWGQKNSIENPVVQELKMLSNFARKSVAAVATLGTGSSLGPEGPCVEIGLNVARAYSNFNRPVPSRNAGRELNNGGDLVDDVDSSKNGVVVVNTELQRGWTRVLLSCGAAAGVAAGFNAPIAGVFFSLEIMQNTFSAIDKEEQQTQEQQQLVLVQQNKTMQQSTSNNIKTFQQQSLTSTTSIAPILIASVLSALISQALLGNHLILRLTQFELDTPLVELPLYLLLGALSGVVAFCFTYSAKLSQQFFAGELGNEEIRRIMSSIPNFVKPAIGGLFCGLVGIVFPQILFFGYETLNNLLKNGGGLPLDVLMSLLVVKIITTAFSAGSGLVGGTFAPSLFLGAMLGGMFHEGAVMALQTIMDILPDEATAQFASVRAIPEIASVPAYAMVGAASVLAALFRSPLTASLLLFEVTRNYDVILPLMASAGIGSIVGDILEDRLERRDQMERRDQDPVSWGDLADDQARSGNSGGVMVLDKEKKSPSSSEL